MRSRSSYLPFFSFPLSPCINASYRSLKFFVRILSLLQPLSGARKDDLQVVPVSRLFKDIFYGNIVCWLLVSNPRSLLFHTPENVDRENILGLLCSVSGGALLGDGSVTINFRYITQGLHLRVLTSTFAAFVFLLSNCVCGYVKAELFISNLSELVFLITRFREPQPNLLPS